MFDDDGEPALTGDASADEWDAHDQWLAHSCEHGGVLAAERLANITLAKHLRQFLKGLQGTAGPRFPILLDKVLYDGTHTGDRILSRYAPGLLNEVDLVLHSSDILAPSEKAFFHSMRRLCEASIETGNPIVF